MSKLSVDQKTIYSLLSDKKISFLIPDYQRPYAWDEEQCQTLWDDIFLFSFPNNNYEAFDENEEYFLGSIVTYKNQDGKSEVIDGQQRLTTLLLILRAFYDKFSNMQDQNSKLTRERIEQCIWKTDTFGAADKSMLKINSEVATDDDKQEFLDLLKTGQAKPDSKSRYVNNYRFIQKKIDEFLHGFASYFPYLPARILGNCIILPIEAESQDTALRIFSTLNDRGLPLSDADIFKAQFYKYYGDLGEKKDFIERWKELEEVARLTFPSGNASPMDELFARYMYFLRAKEGNRSTTTEALRKFYERDKYKYLKQPGAMDVLKALALFWKSVRHQDKDRFSDDVRKRLFVLNYAPNGMWQNITSVYFLQNRKESDLLDDGAFVEFLNKITAFIFAYAIFSPGVNALRNPVYDEMVNIVNGVEVGFSKYKFNEFQLRSSFENYQFSNQRNVTRSMLTWYAYTFPEQQLLAVDEVFNIEHIYAKKRQEVEGGLQNDASLELLGNKVLLEESINIRASDYRFVDKKNIYCGKQRRGKNKDASKIFEINKIANYDVFNEDEIVGRNKLIFDGFFSFLRNEKLLVISE
ncbi:Uncharacterized conserved protein, contains ParB-like and HNH nuclease domains [Lampropedia hyalina DSM 16112]|jgi:hypothetical protein|uniref:Uncharacterized conserved protein, contains ParB-like and HNH nuclease domains n=1 Tax=Lampropedia hyalina DSM 16112 TaxID=1122156 RepID=A0A1M4WY91_9BURK|nr:DUF262 domain-containing protein [Lampropedia hyalina]SHE85932.1 Uncharacterized conserved protein, contains ParB-like and HNH nuclease domains [Lampropedia hyalina DSM 16112]